VKYARYRWPTLTAGLEKISQLLKPAPVSLASEHILSTSNQPDAGEHSLAHKLQHSDEAFQPLNIAAECLNHLAAGIDTTGDALCFLMHQLSKPESSHVQEKLIAELAPLASADGKTLDELPYLDAVVREGLRCFPPIPMSQPRYVPPGGRTIDGWFVPGGAVVSCQAWSVHQLNEEIFVRGAEFWPERWLDVDAAAKIKMNKLFFSFSAGGRSCTGKQ
jgi:cytochrome P450